MACGALVKAAALACLGSDAPPCQPGHLNHMNPAVKIPTEA